MEIESITVPPGTAGLIKFWFLVHQSVFKSAKKRKKLPAWLDCIFGLVFMPFMLCWINWLQAWQQ